MTNEPPNIELTPLTRICMSLDEEVFLNPDRYADEQLIDGYVGKYKEWEHKRDATLRSVIVLDAGLAFLLAGNTLKVPVFDIETSAIPIILELVTILASFGFMMLAHAFANVTAYDLVIGTLIRRQPKSNLMDSDFIKASKTTFDFAVKTFKIQFIAGGHDPFIPGRGFRILVGLFSILAFLIFVLVPMTHFYIVIQSVIQTYINYGAIWQVHSYACLLAVLGAATLITMIAPWVGFNFTVSKDVFETYGPRDPQYYYSELARREKEARADANLELPK